jgi:hypothetical protein
MLVGAFLRYIVFGAAVGISATAAADGGDSSRARAELQLSDEEGGAQAALRNQTYDLVRAGLGPDRSALTNLLVHRQQDLVTNVQTDGFLKKELTVSVFKVDALKKTKLFQIKERAEASKIRQDLGIFVATNYGCCDSTDVHIVYSLTNGHRLFFTGGEREPYIFDAFWPNTDREQRLVGVHLSGSERDAEIYKGLGNKKGCRCLLVSLASRTELLDRVVIKFGDVDASPPAVSIGWLPGAEMKVHDQTLEVWPSDRSQPSAAPTIQIALSPKEKITIPLGGDRFGAVSAPDAVKVIHLSPTK